MALAGTETRVFGAAPSSYLWDHLWKEYLLHAKEQEYDRHECWLKDLFLTHTMRELDEMGLSIY